IKGGQFLQTLKSEVLPVKMGDVNYDIKKGLFSSGKLAMDINGPWSIADYRNAGIDFGVAPHPAIEGKPMTSFSGVKAYYVNAFTTYPNAAKLFAAYLSSAESQMVNFEMNGTLPANKDVAADPKIQGDEITKAFLEQFNNSTPRPSLPAMDSVWGPISAAITDIWDGGKDVKTSLDNAVNQVKESLATVQ
ncbi:extracellular solute-binding protein, partial [Bacillus subtilis]|uniref:extracellular solute-binding protein n=1 Tax=Bacillus subtilis TaxID=1423 RepID=UPI003F7C7256